ncbi:hypothetical protein A2U01_0090530, partial [Trifolium medium]|nr:hypothetical protein [Trifolium medium]
LERKRWVVVEDEDHGSVGLKKMKMKEV